MRVRFEVTKVAQMAVHGKRADIERPVGSGIHSNQMGGSDPFVATESTGLPIREITMYALGSRESGSAISTGTITFILEDPSLVEQFQPGMDYEVEFKLIPKK